MSRRERSEPALPSRRQFLSLGVGAFVIAAVPLARAQRRQLIRRSIPVMGTVAELAVVHREPHFAHGALDAAVAELRRVEALMTRFQPTSDVGRVNAAAHGHPTGIDLETATVLAAALEWAAATEGGFDPSLGRATELWDIGHRAVPPAADHIERWAKRDLYRTIELGRRAYGPVVVRHDDDAALDLGGIAKGYAVDRAVAALRDWGITDGLVNVGGDLYALGRSADGDLWEVGVRSPADPARLVAEFRIEERAVATSGDYFRYFDHRGRRYHHLLDPCTGEPRRTQTHSFTVAADDCMNADAAATALFGAEPAATRRILGSVAPDAAILHRG